MEPLMCAAVERVGEMSGKRAAVLAACAISNCDCEGAREERKAAGKRCSAAARWRVLVSAGACAPAFRNA